MKEVSMGVLREDPKMMRNAEVECQVMTRFGEHPFVMSMYFSFVAPKEGPREEALCMIMQLMPTGVCVCLCTSPFLRVGER